MKTGRKKWRHRRHRNMGGHPGENLRWEDPGELAQRYSETMEGDADDPYGERRKEMGSRNPVGENDGYYADSIRATPGDGLVKKENKARNTRYRNQVKGYRKKRGDYYSHHANENASSSIDEHLNPKHGNW